MRSRLSSILCVIALGILGASCGGDTPNSPSGDVMRITIVGTAGNMSFSPEVASVRVGQTVQFANNDAVTHQIVSDTGNLFDTGAFSAGTTSRSFTLASAGTLGYHCTIHPSMVGTITVTP